MEALQVQVEQLHKRLEPFMDESQLALEQKLKNAQEANLLNLLASQSAQSASRSLDHFVTPDLRITSPNLAAESQESPSQLLEAIGTNAMHQWQNTLGDAVTSLFRRFAEDHHCPQHLISVHCSVANPRSTGGSLLISAGKALFNTPLTIQFDISAAPAILCTISIMGRCTFTGSRVAAVDFRYDPQALSQMIQTTCTNTFNSRQHST